MTLAAACVTACPLVIKLADIVLSLKKGLAIIVLALAMANAAVVVFGGIVFGSVLSTACASYRPIGPIAIGNLVGAACSSPVLTIGMAALAALTLTLLLYSQDLYRGIDDVGFIGASLRAERKRRQGI